MPAPAKRNTHRSNVALELFPHVYTQVLPKGLDCILENMAVGHVQMNAPSNFDISAAERLATSRGVMIKTLPRGPDSRHEPETSCRIRSFSCTGMLYNCVELLQGSLFETYQNQHHNASIACTSTFKPPLNSQNSTHCTCCCDELLALDCLRKGQAAHGPICLEEA